MLPFKLDRPLAVFDIESTGVNPRLDRIIDLAIFKFTPDGHSESHVFRFHPEMPIPAEATAIHHIADADVVGCPPFREKAAQIAELLQDCDLAGFNVARFDIPLLIEEFARAGVGFSDAGRRVLDAQRIFHRKEPRDLTAALAFYCSESHAGAHDAEADVQATINVLKAQFERYADLPHDMTELDKYCNPPRNAAWVDRSGKLKWVGDEIVINFGAQYNGQKLRDLARDNPKFLKWIIKSDFPTDTKKIVGDALESRFPSKPNVPPAETE